MAYFTKEEMDATKGTPSFDPNSGSWNDPNSEGSYPYATLQPDGRYYLPDDILASSDKMKGDGAFFGFDLMGEGNLMEGFKVIAMFAAPAIMGMSGLGASFAESSFGSWLSETTSGWGNSISNFFGGVSNASGAVADASWGVNALADTAGTVAETGINTLTEGATGLSTAPADMLAGPTMSPGADSFGNFDMGNGTTGTMGTTGGAAAAASKGGGLIDSVINWGKQNQALASGAMQMVGGALKGMGDRSTALEITDKRIAADNALLDKRTQEQIELDAAKKAAIQSGSYFDAKTNIRPGANVLRRPDGTPVYGNGGLIVGQMN